MEKQVIFFPKTLLESNDITFNLLGFTKFMKNVRYFFILSNCINNTDTEYKLVTIGHFTRSNCQFCLKQKVTNILCITEINGNLNANLLAEQYKHFVLIVYDPSSLHDYGKLLEYKSDSQKLICFAVLSKWLSTTKNKQKHNQVSKYAVFQNFIKYLLIILNVLINSFETKFVQLTILRLTLFKHLFCVIKNYVWLIENLVHNKQTLSRPKAINYLMSCICDAFFGITILYLLNTIFTSSNELFSFISSISHVNKYIYINEIIHLNGSF